jgi:hypothetical protein
MLLVVWLGALLLVAGLVALAIPPIRRARLSGRQPRAGVAVDTLEPRKPGAGFGLASNWPGLALVGLGALLLLLAAAA